jgi:pilus assembly protein CpaE
MHVHVISSPAAGRLTERVRDTLLRSISAATITNSDLLLPIDLEARANLARPELTVIVRHEGDEAQVLTLLAELTQDNIRPTIVVGSAADSKFVLSALRSGADEYLDQSDLNAELETALTRLMNGHKSSAASQVVGVLAAGGGAGASTIAVNLAARWASENRRAILFDLKPLRGDLGALLDLTPSYSLSDVCANDTRLDRAMLDSILTNHSSGISLLASPPDAASARYVIPAPVRNALRIAKAMVPVVVLDLAAVDTEAQLAAASQLTRCFLICRLEFSSLRQAKRVLTDLANVGLPNDRICLVANQVGRPGELAPDEAEHVLGRPIRHFVPYEPRTVIEANNTGIPAIVSHPESRFAHVLLAMAGTSHSIDSSKGLLSTLKGLCGLRN